jgi:hypothetical protein
VAVVELQDQVVVEKELIIQVQVEQIILLQQEEQQTQEVVVELDLGVLLLLQDQLVVQE